MLIKNSGRGKVLVVTMTEWLQIAKRQGWLPKTAKWSGSPEIEQTGEYASKTIKELEDMKSSLQKRQEKKDKADPSITKKLRQINFAIRSKKKDKWGDTK